LPRLTRVIINQKQKSYEKNFYFYDAGVTFLSRIEDRQCRGDQCEPNFHNVVAYFNLIELGENGRIVINDLQGRKVENLPLQSEQNQQVIDLSTYPNGIYLINLYVNDKLIASVKLSKGLK
jgi:hypothetical protein